MSRRLAISSVVMMLLLPMVWRRFDARPRQERACVPEGRGIPPRHWIGCSADPGPRRALTGPELLLLGLPLDLNSATLDDLAVIPGLSPKLAASLVEDRERRGPFSAVDELDRVRGIGPVRLERARRWLRVSREPSDFTCPPREHARVLDELGSEQLH